MNFDDLRQLIAVTIINHSHRLQALIDYGRFADDLVFSALPGLMSLVS